LLIALATTAPFVVACEARTIDLRSVEVGFDVLPRNECEFAGHQCLSHGESEFDSCPAGSLEHLEACDDLAEKPEAYRCCGLIALNPLPENQASNECEARPFVCYAETCPANLEPLGLSCGTRGFTCCADPPLFCGEPGECVLATQGGDCPSGSVRYGNAPCDSQETDRLVCCIWRST
jgi:hypothetical protein